MGGQAQADNGGAVALARKLAPFVVFAVIALIPPPAGLERNQWIYFAIFAGAIAGLVFESASPGAVGFVAMRLVAIFFWAHYFSSSITSHTAAIFPIVLAIGKSITGMPMTELVMPCAFSLGLMGVISPYATGPAPMFYGAGYISRGAFWAPGLVFGLVYFAALLGIGLPWLHNIGY